MNTCSFPPPLPLRMLFPPPPQVQCHRYSAGLAAFLLFLLHRAVQRPALPPLHTKRSAHLCWRPSPLHAPVWNTAVGTELMGKGKAGGTSQTAQAETNIKVTWSWLPMTHYTVHFLKPQETTPEKQGFFHNDCHHPKNAQQAHKKRQIISQPEDRKARGACTAYTFLCICSLSFQLFLWRQQESAQLCMRARNLEGTGQGPSVWSSRCRNIRSAWSQGMAVALEAGSSLNWRTLQCWEVSHYTQTHLHHDFALLAPEPSVTTQ